MTDEVNPTTETVETPAQAAGVTEVIEQKEEAFDQERAMLTIHKLRQAEKEAKAQLKELSALKADAAKRAEAEMTEAQRLQKQAEEATAENMRLKSDILKRDVSAETGLPAVFADRLKGATKEEMLADAQEIMKALIPTQQKVAPRLSPTNPANAQLVESDAQKRERLFGRQQNIFDVNSIKQAGGGVVWPTKQE